MISNLKTYFETSSRIRGGEAVWVKDSNGENRAGVTNGCSIANPPKGFGHIWAAQLFQFKPGNPGYIFRTFKMKTATAAPTDKTIYVDGDGYSDAPEVGMVLMKAPKALKTTTYQTSTTSGIKQVNRLTVTAGCSTSGNVIVSLDGVAKKVAVTTTASTAAAVAAVIAAASYSGYTVSYTAGNDYVDFTANAFGDKSAPSFDGGTTDVTATIEETVEGAFNVAISEVDYTGQSAVVTAVVYDSTDSKFTVTLDTALGDLTLNDILVEASGTEASATASVLVTNPNTFIEADKDLLPSDPIYGLDNVNHIISTVYDKKAWIGRMQPLPEYVLAKNRSLIEGIFWI